MTHAVLDIETLHLIIPEEFIFGPENANFYNNPEHDLFFLSRQQHYFNDRLQVQGYLFLNDILSVLGIPLVQIGQLVGWTQESFVDLRITEADGVFSLNPNWSGVILKELGNV
jgi:hypothetical protein